MKVQSVVIKREAMMMKHQRGGKNGEENCVANELLHGSRNKIFDVEGIARSFDTFLWTIHLDQYQSKLRIPPETEPVVLADVNRATTELEIFLKLFEKISFYTNIRLQLLGSEKPSCVNMHDTRAEKNNGCIKMHSGHKLQQSTLKAYVLIQ